MPGDKVHGTACYESVCEYDTGPPGSKTVEIS